MKLSTVKLGRVIRLMSGHNWLNYFLNKLDPDISPLCGLCEEEDETFGHWATECQVLRTTSTEILEVATNECILIPNKWCLDKILCFSYVNILNFVIESGMSFNVSALGLGVSFDPKSD